MDNNHHNLGVVHHKEKVQLQDRLGRALLEKRAHLDLGMMHHRIGVDRHMLLDSSD